MTDLVTDCVADIEAKIKTLSEFSSGSKAATLYGADEFLDLSKDLSPPLAAVIYGGSYPKNNEKGGLSVELVVSVNIISDRETKDVLGAYSLLYNIRNVIKNTISPSGHPWIFQGELPLDIGTGMGYVQHWSVDAMFTN